MKMSPVFLIVEHFGDIPSLVAYTLLAVIIRRKARVCFSCLLFILFFQQFGVCE